MNKKTKTKIKKLIIELQSGHPDLEDVHDVLSDILFDEEMERDNMEEYFSETERYQIISDNCDALDEAVDSIDIDNPDCIEDVVAALKQIDGV